MVCGCLLFTATSCPNLNAACLLKACKWSDHSTKGGKISEYDWRCVSSECKKAALQLKGSRIRKQMPAEREQQDMDPVSRPAWMFKVYKFMLFHAISFYTLSDRKTLRSKATLFAQAQSQLALWHNILRSSTIGSNCLVQQCLFVSRTAWRCMTISWVRKPVGGQV